MLFVFTYSGLCIYREARIDIKYQSLIIREMTWSPHTSIALIPAYPRSVNGTAGLVFRFRQETTICIF